MTRYNIDGEQGLICTGASKVLLADAYFIFDSKERFSKQTGSKSCDADSFCYYGDLCNLGSIWRHLSGYAVSIV